MRNRTETNTHTHTHTHAMGYKLVKAIRANKNEPTSLMKRLI